jgi:hypothetical protein
MSWYEDDDDTQGWGSEANGDLLDAVEAGLPALLAYAREQLEVRMPSTDEVLELLDDADQQAELVSGDDARSNAELAVARLRRQLAAVPAFAEAA